MLPEWTVIGFSGHRKLADPKVVAAGIGSALERLAANQTPLAAVSSAASGSDTLFLEGIARHHLPCLIILPFPKDRFQQDFSPADWQRVLPLIDQATRVEEVTGEESSAAAYMEAGIRTADRADVLIVVWDGKPAAGLGGTGDVVAYARKFEMPLLIVDPDTGKISEERLEQLPVRSASSDWKNNPRQTVERHFQELNETAERHAPRSRYLILWIILLQLIASAIGLTVLAFGAYMYRIIVTPLSALVELILLGIAFIASFQHRKPHHEWMKSRVSAEICRSFLAIWDIYWREEHPLNLSIQGFSGLCKNLRLMRTLDGTRPPSLESARDAYLKNRVEHQIQFFSVKSGLAQKKFRMCRFLMLATTAAAALCSFLALIHPWLHKSDLVLEIFKYLSLLLPLASAAIFVLIVTQDYSRRTIRYAELALMLKNAQKQLEEVRTWNTLARIAAQTEEELLQEVVEWHSFRRFAGEPG